MEIQVLKAWTETKKMLGEGLLPIGCFNSHRLLLFKQIKTLAKEQVVSENVVAEKLEKNRLAANKSQDSCHKSLK